LRLWRLWQNAREIACAYDEIACAYGAYGGVPAKSLA